MPMSQVSPCSRQWVGRKRAISIFSEGRCSNRASAARRRLARQRSTLIPTAASNLFQRRPVILSLTVCRPRPGVQHHLTSALPIAPTEPAHLYTLHLLSAL